MLLTLFPTVIFGGVTLLRLLIDRSEGYVDNPVRQDLWRAGHTHAGVLLLLSLVVLRYVDEASLSTGVKSLVRHSAPVSAILLPVAYFLSIASATATEPNGLIRLAYAGAAILAVELFTLGMAVGLFWLARLLINRKRA